jgi:hypothetical protein
MPTINGTAKLNGASELEAYAGESPPPAPRRSVFLLENSRWCEDGKVRTAGKRLEVDLPLPIAKRALELGHALEVNSELAQRLRATLPRSYARMPEDLCVDIEQPKQPQRMRYFAGRGSLATEVT